MQRVVGVGCWGTVVLAWASVTLTTGCRDANAAVGEHELPDLATRHTGEDWPGFLGPRGDSKSAERGLATAWPEDGPPIKWQRPLNMSYGIGVIARGRYYQLDRAGNEAQVHCWHSETGESLWTYSYPTNYEDHYGYNNGPRCSPVIDEDRVYAYGAEGMLHCLHAATGEVIWKVDTRTQFGVVQNFFGVGSTPIVEGELLIVVVGGSPPDAQDVAPGRLDLVNGNGSGIVAFEKRTGRVKYQLTDELAGYAGPVTATIGKRRWCFVFARGGLVAFDPTRGELDFHYPWRARPLESVNASNPVVVGDEVFISETYGPGSSLLRVRPEGKGFDVVWRDEAHNRQKAMQTHWNTPIHHEGYLYGSSGRHTQNAELRCIEWETGKPMWSQAGLTRGSLLYVDGQFIYLGEDGVLRLIRATPERFELRAECDLHGPAPTEPSEPRTKLLTYPAWAAPILAHGLLYVRGNDRVVCLDLSTP